jgi:hypothetical protein
MRILRIDTKTVRRYYERVNRARRRSGLPPLNPRSGEAPPSRKSL